MIGLVPRAFGCMCTCLCIWSGACAAETSGDSLSEDEQVARAASATLACPEASVRVEALDSSGEYLAIGCGQVMRFECDTHAVCCPYVSPSENLAPELMPSESTPSEPTTPAETGRTKESIRALIGARIESVRACYQMHLDSFAWPSDMWPQGKIVVTFTIAAEGAVTEAVLARTSYGDPGVERCLLDVIRGLRFEPATDAGIVRVTYPFLFRSEGEPPNTCRGVPAVAPVPPGSEDVI